MQDEKPFNDDKPDMDHMKPIFMNERAFIPDMEELSNVVLFDVVNGQEVRRKKPVRKFSFKGRDFDLATALG